MRPTFPEPPEGVFPSFLAPLLPYQPSITLLPSAGPIPFRIWQYFPPGNGLVQTEDPQPSLESCTLLMGRSPKSNKNCPLGWEECHPKQWPCTVPGWGAQAILERHSPCPCWGGFLAPGSLLEEGCGALGTMVGSRSHPVPTALPQISVPQGKGAIGGLGVETGAVGGTGEAVGKIRHGRAQRQACHVGHSHGVPCGKDRGCQGALTTPRGIPGRAWSYLPAPAAPGSLCLRPGSWGRCRSSRW